ncbi:MAG: helix-turn-helix transcriptional regulator [Lachnospiraceae bacterium]|nr:helix-turn-helix transcriptional regulator [Lachnospiraceae bacterium]
MEILLWQLRTRNNYTLMQLAEITGISKSEINAIENGKVSPRLETLESLAAGLGVNICDLYKSSITDSGN